MKLSDNIFGVENYELEDEDNLVISIPLDEMGPWFFIDDLIRERLGDVHILDTDDTETGYVSYIEKSRTQEDGGGTIYTYDYYLSFAEVEKYRNIRIRKYKLQKLITKLK
jgi:hypothetical protein